ncbi:MAG: hypothetical protein ACK56F_22745, partial [bacterium]
LKLGLLLTVEDIQALFQSSSILELFRELDLPKTYARNILAQCLYPCRLTMGRHLKDRAPLTSS